MENRLFFEIIVTLEEKYQLPQFFFYDMVLCFENQFESWDKMKN